MTKMQSLLKEGWKICMTACCYHSPERLSFASRSAGIQHPRKEIILLGNVLLGRGRFAFEVQELDQSPYKSKKLMAKEKEIERTRSGGYGYANSIRIGSAPIGCKCSRSRSLRQSIPCRSSLTISLTSILPEMLSHFTSSARRPATSSQPAGTWR